MYRRGSRRVGKVVQEGRDYRWLEATFNNPMLCRPQVSFGHGSPRKPVSATSLRNTLLFRHMFTRDCQRLLFETR
jgi:hypothetical protein